MMKRMYRSYICCLATATINYCSVYLNKLFVIDGVAKIFAEQFLWMVVDQQKQPQLKPSKFILIALWYTHFMHSKMLSRDLKHPVYHYTIHSYNCTLD